jgi:hypothetical protein
MTLTREALINLANHLDVARMQANDIQATALETRVYTDVVNALKDTLVLITGDRERAEKVYQSILDGNTAERALEWEQGVLDAQAPSGPKFPDVQVQLSGEDGNAFFIVGRVRKALERAGHREAAVEFFNEALSGDYDHVLQTCMIYVEVL